MYTRMHRGANPSSAMSAATKGASARATMRPSEMKTQSASGSRGRVLVRISNLPPWLSPLCMVIYIKEEPVMQISVSSTLTVYLDGQFWVGPAEHVEGGRYGVARIVFGAEPSDEEILRFVVGKWKKLSFFGGEATETSKPAKNPKRYAREVSKALKQPAMGTKAQQALAAQREAMKRKSAQARSRLLVDANGDGYARARTRHRTSQLVSQVFGTHTRRSKMRSDSTWLETEPRCPTSRPPAAPRYGRCRRQSEAFPRTRSGRDMPGTRRQCAWCCRR